MIRLTATIVNTTDGRERHPIPTGPPTRPMPQPPPPEHINQINWTDSQTRQSTAKNQVMIISGSQPVGFPVLINIILALHHPQSLISRVRVLMGSQPWRFMAHQ
ncbi:hypothetical protein EZV62_006738 [Acer yangbiense]|uniref:Uncharacterized protein n=1 Tax=Acer yangbiense TaxID=1000413 RepID=A0A5C7I7B4_9ROSI|nr:hypothetical protein EZV62_006738 [Acer yangbiense]